MIGDAAVQDEFDEVEAQYKIEKAQLTELELRFEPLEAEFKAILEERDLAYRARMTAEREDVRRRQAALTVQAWWRSYRVRKACMVAAKKRAKAAAKEKKKAKGISGVTIGKEGKERKRIAVCATSTAPLRELTCHMGSHSATCHPAEVTFPPLPQPIKAGTRFSDPRGMQG